MPSPIRPRVVNQPSEETAADRARIVGVIAFLVGTSIVAHRAHVLPGYIVVALAAVLLLSLARFSGLDVDELGL